MSVIVGEELQIPREHLGITGVDIALKLGVVFDRAVLEVDRKPLAWLRIYLGIVRQRAKELLRLLGNSIKLRQRRAGSLPVQHESDLDARHKAPPAADRVVGFYRASASQ